MDWSGVPGAVILGLSGLALISLMFWAGQAALNLLGDDIPLGRGSSAKNERAEPLSPGRDLKTAPESRERLATQEEREEVNEIAGKPRPVTIDSAVEPSL